VRAIGFLLATTVACSFSMTRPVPQHAPQQVPECTTSDMAPSLDALAAIVDLAGGAWYAAENGLNAGLANLAVGAIFAASAWYGARNVRACRRDTDIAVSLLVRDAAAAMRDGGCSPVVDIAVHLAQDDPAAYTVFIHDPTFAACF
jgi:hypothetical protein